MSTWRRYPTKVWHDFGEGLLKVKGGESQKAFLRACYNRNDYLRYIDENIPVVGIEGEDILDKFQHRFSPREFADPPADPSHDIQKVIWEMIPIERAGTEEPFTDPCFWGLAVRDMIESEQIEEPSCLAAGRSDQGDDAGSDNIDNALDEGASEKTIDSCVRRILRSMCHESPRGKRVVFDDFPLGRSWWCHRWASRMEGLLPIDREAILNHLLTVRNYDVIVAKMHSSRSYISPDNVFGGLLLFLHGAQVSRAELTRIIDELAFQSAWQAIELRSPEENRDEIAKIHQSLTSA